jgi:hypothetical protein
MSGSPFTTFNDANLFFMLAAPALRNNEARGKEKSEVWQAKKWVYPGIDSEGERRYMCVRNKACHVT